MHSSQQDLFEAYSFVCSNVSSEVCTYQKLVFDKFNLPITQICKDVNHGVFLNEAIKNCKAKYIIFFDIDCVPLTADIYDIIIYELELEKCIIGAEQMCNYNYEKSGIGHIYAAPACLGIPVQLYNDIGMPTLDAVGPYRSDVAEELTWRCEENNIKVKLFNITHSEICNNVLDGTRTYGPGSTYSYNGKEVLYHQFEIRHHSNSFLNKCKHVLNSN